MTGVTVPGSVIIGDAAGAGTSLVRAPTQSIFASSMALFGGSGGGTAAVTGDATQTISAVAAGLSLSAGSGAGASAMISAPTHDIVVSGAVALTGSAAPAGSPALAVVRSTSGPQIVTAGSGGINLNANPAAQADALVAIENLGATAQTILTPGNDVRLDSRGAATVAVTSGGTQTLDARGLDVLTRAATGPLAGANASVTAAGDQTIHASGNLAGAAAPGIGMRVAALGTGTAKIESTAGTQTLNVGHPGGVEGQLLIGRLDFGPPITGIVDPTTGNPAAGNSHVIAANQTVNAGSIFIQGPTGAGNKSRLSATATQTITTHVAGINLIGGSALDAIAEIDPTNQTITSFGPMYLQGGTGPNADAIINAAGPQTVTTLNGPITLQGGQGAGADALIANSTSFQTINAAGGVIIPAAPPGGGIGALRPTAQTGNFADDVITGEIVRERDRLEYVIDEWASRENEEPRNRGGIQLCR